MKNGFILSVIGLLLILTACHTRKVAIVKSDSVSVRNKTFKSDSSVTKIDTSKKVKKDSTVTTKSDSTVITETGNFINGKLNGQGTKTITKKSNSKKTKTSNQIDETAIINHSEIQKDSTVKDSVATTSKTKMVNSTPNYSLLLWLLIPIIGGIILRYLSSNKGTSKK